MPDPNYTYLAFERDSERLYNHWLDIKAESPHDLLRRFNDLFIEGVGYQDQEILQVRNRILNSPWSEQNFKHILNRCCYILINNWWSEEKIEIHQATPRLVALFKTKPVLPSTTPETDCLRKLTQAFTQTQQYEMLEQRLRIDGGCLNRDQIGNDNSRQPISELVNRYPPLYPYYLQDDDTGDGKQYAIAQLQARREKQFEQHLSRYIINRLRHPDTRMADDNPTLLSDQQLTQAVKLFAGKAKGSRSYQDSARHFFASLDHAQSHFVVKQQIHNYLTTSIDPGYSDRHFNTWLHEQLNNALPHNDHHRPGESLLVKTCGHLLDALIAHPKNLSNSNHLSSNHVVFLDLNSNLGTTHTIGLVLKIVLLCRTVQTNLDAIKARVAKRFAEMFKYYEVQVQGQVSWLTECLDNLMVAYAIHFGRGGVSRWESLL
ncbi:hypothetical protein BST81_02170 [Leptolyngbya sp. 'hensonii']|uniref:hypothetical protein n=1 Tax=Leptolyngbya sp. 'hensonii' TaxID=1922337 RepID=UPI00094F6A80|nr:hypothetical protein [Leptolyngbya sp. 'hensonii']OLP20066.1 hypothetical protein BST81_02170 [Leptolyngbya sp. 'hensonii']